MIKPYGRFGVDSTSKSNPIIKRILKFTPYDIDETVTAPISFEPFLYADDDALTFADGTPFLFAGPDV